VDLVVPREIVEFATVARKSLSKPGLELARSIESNGRVGDAFEALDALGFSELDPTEDAEQGLAAAHLALEVGRAAIPVPFAAIVVGRSLELPGATHAVSEITGGDFLVDHTRAVPPTHVLDMAGTAHAVTTVDDPGEIRPLAPWAGPVRATGETIGLDDAGRRSWAWHEVLSAFSTLGALEEMLDLTRAHLNERHQFGKPLRARQALEHRFVDCVVEVARLREIALYAAWSLSNSDGKPIAAALALRLVHQEVMTTVPRHAHQLHGAVGFCLEHDLAILNRYLQFRRYQPTSHRDTRSHLGQYLNDIPSVY
jgi:hypothetical protein